VLDRNKFVVKGQTKNLEATGNFEIADGESGEALGLGTEKKKGLMATLLGMALGKDNMSKTIEVRKKSDNALLFSVRRAGFFFKKVQVLDAEGQVAGQYKTKKFSLSGGYHIYDKDGKHIAEIKGKMLKSEYKILAPDGAKEMGSVSRTWGGLAKSLLSGTGSYGVQIEQAFAENPNTKILLLGAAIAIDTMFPKKGKEGAAAGGGSEEEASE
jgi:uncharacterized protein YxjI